MTEKINWCEFFQAIEANPKAITPRITVRQLFEAREHVAGCDACNNRVERTLARAPRQTYPSPEKN